MSIRHLLDRQTAILEFLTDPLAFNSGQADPALQGIDLSHLRLEGALSLGKRMDKIRSCLPRTFEYLVHSPAMSAEAFAHRFPPFSAARNDNAAQFVEYLHFLWQEELPDPPFLPDLAALELAIAKAITLENNPSACPAGDETAADYRLNANAQLLLCQFDVRVLFDGSAERAPPAERSVHLVIVPPIEGDMPRVFEVSAEFFSLLNGVGDWRRLDELGGAAGGAQRAQIASLTRHGMVEIR
jgi:hypothetical protein